MLQFRRKIRRFCFKKRELQREEEDENHELKAASLWPRSEGDLQAEGKRERITIINHLRLPSSSPSSNHHPFSITTVNHHPFSITTVNNHPSYHHHYHFHFSLSLTIGNHQHRPSSFSSIFHSHWQPTVTTIHSLFLAKITTIDHSSLPP